MQLKPNEIHVWSIDLTDSSTLAKDFNLLNPEERIRANRFHHELHTKHFIIAHSSLRKILSIYLNISPEDILFSHTQYNKPYLQDSRLQFNMSHSHDFAVYAISLENMLGIDIEQIKPNYTPEVAKRFFSQQENTALNKLSDKEKTINFYRIWSRKEALIKAIGKGLSIPLSSFSVSLHKDMEVVNLENQLWTIVQLSILPNYQIALAANTQQITMISYWQFVGNTPILYKTIST